MNKDLLVIVPSYNPPKDLMKEFMDKLLKKFKNVIIVNDGSDEVFYEYFKQFKDKVVLINHEINKGKGEAVKTAFKYVLDECASIKSVVVADCDNQHTVEDIIKCGKTSIDNPGSFIIGKRDFTLENVPTRSKIGRNISKGIFKNIIGINIGDTQNGLRAISRDLLEKFISIPGERYEYENYTLIYVREENIPVIEVPIETVYINDNASSHFNAVKDTMRIVKVFKKYLGKISIPYIINFILFISIFYLMKNPSDLYGIMFSSIVAGIIAIIIKIILNYKTLYKYNHILDNFISLFKMIIKIFLSAYFIYIFYSIFSLNLLITKLIVDLIITIIVYFVFRRVSVKDEN